MEHVYLCANVSLWNLLDLRRRYFRMDAAYVKEEPGRILIHLFASYTVGKFNGYLLQCLSLGSIEQGLDQNDLTMTSCTAGGELHWRNTREKLLSRENLLQSIAKHNLQSGARQLVSSKVTFCEVKFRSALLFNGLRQKLATFYCLTFPAAHLHLLSWTRRVDLENGERRPLEDSTSHVARPGDTCIDKRNWQLSGRKSQDS